MELADFPAPGLLSERGKAVIMGSVQMMEAGGQKLVGWGTILVIRQLEGELYHYLKLCALYTGLTSGYLNGKVR